MEILQKVDEIRQYFENESTASVRTDRDFDNLAWIFIFVKGSGPLDVLRVSQDVLDDNDVPGIVRRLEKHDWRKVIQTAGSMPTILTRTGFQFVGASQD